MNTSQPNYQPGHEEDKSHLIDAATQLFNESKKLAAEIYEEHIQKVNEAQDTIKDYTDEMTHKVKTNPVSSLLVAVGIGYLMSFLFRK